MWKYQGMAYALILKDLGALLQTMYLVATAMNLAPCALGSGDTDLFAEATGLNPLEEASVGEFHAVHPQNVVVRSALTKNLIASGVLVRVVLAEAKRLAVAATGVGVDGSFTWCGPTGDPALTSSGEGRYLICLCPTLVGSVGVPVRDAK
jgi:hypothetical protein